MANTLLVITRAKDLTSYIFQITEKSPKKFRLTIINRMINISLDIVENLLRANSCNANQKSKRVEYQHQAKVSVDMLVQLAEIARVDWQQ